MYKLGYKPPGEQVKVADGVGDTGRGDKEAPPAAAALGGFLGSLMGSMEKTHKSVAGTAAGKGRHAQSPSKPSQPHVFVFLFCLFVGREDLLSVP